MNVKIWNIVNYGNF